MGFLKSSRKEIANNHHGFGDKLASRIMDGYSKTQKMFANKMNKAVGSMSNKRLKVTLILFCVLVGGYSGWLIVKSVAFPPKKETVWQMEQVKRPANIDKAGDEAATADVYVDEYTYRQIQLFKTYMDSLRGANRRLYDSILVARPHLMDSVLALENFYQIQNQK